MYDLKNNNHHSVYLQRSFNKYGEKSLTFEVILEMIEYNEELLRIIEYYYIEELKPSFNSAAPCIYEQTQHWRDKISASTKQLYKEGYINPRRDVGKRYNVYKSLIDTMTILQRYDWDRHVLLNENDNPLAEADQGLVQTIAGFLGKQMES